MTIIVDREKCQEHGQCALTAPVAFRMTEEGHLEYQTEVDKRYRDEVEEAADGCPVQAILVKD